MARWSKSMWVGGAMAVVVATGCGEALEGVGLGPGASEWVAYERTAASGELARRLVVDSDGAFVRERFQAGRRMARVEGTLSDDARRELERLTAVPVALALESSGEEDEGVACAVQVSHARTGDALADVRYGGCVASDARADELLVALDGI